MDAVEFSLRLANRRLKALDRAAAVLWFLTEIEDRNPVFASDLAEVVEAAGYGQQNRSRLAAGLAQDRRFTGTAKTGFRLHPRFVPEFEAAHLGVLSVRPAPEVNTVLPLELFSGARGYIRKVVVQLNAAYEYSLFDCGSVMARRLLETLIIETYEAKGRQDDLKGADGNFMMFSGLLGVVEADPSVLGLSRNAKKGLTDFKKLGDLSAHNRRFNAVQNDIDRIRDGIRVASEELLHLCGQGPSPGGQPSPRA
jgi:hypothetical protein